MPLKSQAEFEKKTMANRTALLLVDLQRDYFDRPGLVPAEPVVIAEASKLLDGFRAQGAKVAHIRTLVSATGDNAMPHWQANPVCVEGTAGAEPPTELAERSSEPVFAKQFFRGFANPEVNDWLVSNQIETVVIAGLYTHACVRETALDAYEHGYQVVIAADAIGSNAPTHASESLEWLTKRAASAKATQQIHEELAESKIAEPDQVDSAVKAAFEAQKLWVTSSIEERITKLKAWATELEFRANDIAEQIALEVNKPLPMAIDEVARAVAQIRFACTLDKSLFSGKAEVANQVFAEPKPLGVVAALMPFNNPVALPVGKIAPALLMGNAVVFKPSPEATETSKLLLNTLESANLPIGLVSLVSGDNKVGQRLILHPKVAGVTVTGSISTGQAIAQVCARLGKPLQAELGGNNAAIVLADANLAEVVPQLINNAFAYSGQRCTAIRRFIVLEQIAPEFTELAMKETTNYQKSPMLGELVSETAKARVAQAIAATKASGEELLVEGNATLVLSHNFNSGIVQQETFGPVAVIQIATDFEHALELANGVKQGLVMAICTSDEQLKQQFAAQAQAGILNFDASPLPVHVAAPFGGWKNSGLGPAEHGTWDAQFYTRPQASYKK